MTLCILGFGVLTGGSINPARTIGPAGAAGLYEEAPLYVAAQLVGANRCRRAVSLVLGAAGRIGSSHCAAWRGSPIAACNQIH